MLSSSRVPAPGPNRDPPLWGDSLSRPFLPTAQPGLLERQRLQARSSHSSPGARGRADVVAQGGHVQRSPRGAGERPGRADHPPPSCCVRLEAGWFLLGAGLLPRRAKRQAKARTDDILEGRGGLGSFTIGSFVRFSLYTLRLAVSFAATAVLTLQELTTPLFL